MSDPAEQPILILGMHRSGTSFLAQLKPNLRISQGVTRDECIDLASFGPVSFQEFESGRHIIE